ncbi:hypothetical protein [uncultured Bacteroides sp.]|uniref:hypothetical protein n=1 Tax=uncultured Bacteroides sp. TaxID=162156 RepID=UPI0026765F91|nr:hypothetical protein [uncultured Bacteroides sp.]
MSSTATKPFIGLKRVWYGDVVSTVTTPASGYTASELKTLIGTLTEIKNVHQDTWGYDESDPSVTDYINELTGQPYYRDVTQAAIPTVNFTLGEYSFEDKAALQGGKIASDGWERQNMANLIEKCIVAQTKTGNFIFIPRANIVGKGSFVEKNIGLGVSAVPLETGVDGLASEKWFKEADVDLESKLK